MGKQRLSPENITAIIVAVVGVIGTIAAAYFAFRGSTLPLELSLRATQTAEARQTSPSKTAGVSADAVTVTRRSPPSWTPTSVAEENTPPAATQTSVPAAEPDFSANCISAAWTPLSDFASPTRQGNCWDLSSQGFAAQNGKLLLVVQSSMPQTGALYTSLPSTGSISFKANIDTFTAGDVNANLAFGVGAASDTFPDGQYLFFRTTDSGTYLVYGTSPALVGKMTIDYYKPRSDVLVAFKFHSLAFDLYLNNTKIVPSIPFTSSQVFWIGYVLPANSSLAGTISDFHVEE